MISCTGMPTTVEHLQAANNDCKNLFGSDVALFRTREFVDAVLRDRKPWVDIAQSLNMTVSGIVAHQSALEDGELMKIPQY